MHINLENAQTLGKNGRLANMECERDLGLLQKSAPKRCVVERCLSSGLLALINKLHSAAGGRRPDIVSRKQLVAAGAPLRSNRQVRTDFQKLDERIKRAKDKQRAGFHTKEGFTLWANRRWRRARRKNPKEPRKSRDEYRKCMDDLRTQWEACDFSQSEEDQDSDAERVLSLDNAYEYLIGNDLWRCSTREEILRTDKMLHIANKCSRCSETVTGGLTSRLDSARDSYLDECIFHDRAAIPPPNNLITRSLAVVFTQASVRKS